jgi:hypothetical protein
MDDQLGDLLRIMDWSTVTVQILPLANGAHTGLEGAFSVLSFGDEDPHIGYAEYPAGEVYVEAADQVRRVRTVGPECYVNLCGPVDVVVLVSGVPRCFSPGW